MLTSSEVDGVGVGGGHTRALLVIRLFRFCQLCDVIFLAGPQWRTVSIASLGTTSLRKINNNKELKRYENIKLLKCDTN
jgi:hypothetical protein